MLKKLFFSGGMLLMLMAADGQALRTPAPSPSQTIRQEFGISNIELTYSRPAMKGRTIFGNLVPWGKVWRTGANAATRIKFADDVTVGGTTLKAGEYAVYTIPGQSEWTVIFNKGITNWGTDGYKDSQDVARVKVKPVQLNMPQENFTMQFVNVQPSSADLQISWDRTAVNVPIVTNIDTKIMSQIDQLMNKDNRPYFQAAMYYMETGKDMNQALSWLDKAVEANPNAFWMHHQRANALTKLGRKSDARAAAQKSMELARTAGNADYVKLNEDLIKTLN